MNDEISMYAPKFFEAWERMVVSIENTFRYVGDSSEEERPRALQQSRYVLASLAVAQLFKDLDQRELASHFHILAEAMQDLVDGIPHPLFKVETQPRRGRHNNTSAVWRIQSSLCVGIRFMIAGGVTEDEAVSFVMKKHKNSFKKLLRPGAGLRSSINSWLKKFETEDVSNDIALNAYKIGISRVPEAMDKFPGEHLRAAAEKMVADAATRANQLP
ncbi:hypothetical protein NB311A_07198 [Nitrobacter sp. Nb-311A]|uniref:hypothetical protein n=1 Tax=Nitrobacter sp. Nb-311A TaxID=314253 RepID=UPI0000684B99|nr:hypothetical protein [Nitrobacter sp. Nb-311A]EAQ36916.1 hypothetical protein NB311A_07198 [Nitrobacter sp. Nb-311A]